MTEIIQSLEANATNGKENFCYISEKMLLALKELSKREEKENTNLKQALNEIKEYVKSDKALIGCDENDKELFLRDYICCNNILQIIDKVGSNE